MLLTQLKMEWTTILVALISAIGGGGLSTWLDSRYNNVKLLLTTLQEENQRLRAQLEENQKTVQQLNDKVRRQELHLIALDSSHFSHPWPSWIKDEDGKVIVVNRAYEDQFLRPRGFTRFDYIGNNDYAVWPEEIARRYVANDHHVMSDGTTWEGVEYIPSLENPKDIDTLWVIKYPVQLVGTIIGVAGTAVPTKKILEYVAREQEKLTS